MSVCATCQVVCSVPICVDEIIIGTIGAATTDVYVVVHNCTTGRNTLVATQSDGAGLVTLVTANLGFMADQSYEISIILTTGALCDKLTISLGDPVVTSDCLAVSFENIKDENNCPVPFAIQTLTPVVDATPGESCICVTQAMWDAKDGGGQTLSGTYAALTTLLAAGIDTTVYDKIYVTDRSIGLFLDTSTNPTYTPQLSGWYNAQNPDFQDIGVYSAVFALTGIAKGTNWRVYTAALEAGGADGDIYFWNGLIYQLTNLAGTDNTTPDTNPAYTVLPQGVTYGYIAQRYFCLYDFATDTITEIADNGNPVNTMGLNGISNFQFGNNNVYGCTSLNGQFLIVNSRALLLNYIDMIGGGGIVISNDFTGHLSGVTFINSSMNIIGANQLTGCIFENISFTWDSDLLGSQTTGLYINTNESNLAVALDLDDVAIFAAGVLTIPANVAVAGLFTLNSIGAKNITEIIWGPTTKNIRLINGAGFVLTVTSGGGANQPNLKSAANFVGAAGDWIELQSGSVIFETNRANY